MNHDPHETPNPATDRGGGAAWTCFQRYQMSVSSPLTLPVQFDLGRGGKHSTTVLGSDVPGSMGQASPRAVKKTPSPQLRLLGKDPGLSLL